MGTESEFHDQTITFREYATIAIATAACFVASAVPWLSYGNTEMDGFILFLWIAAPNLSAMIANYCLSLRRLGGRRPGAGILILSVGLVPCLIGAVMARVIKDTLTDQSSHNLWPFELIVASIPAGLGATIGAAVGWFIAWIRRLAAKAN